MKFKIPVKVRLVCWSGMNKCTNNKQQTIKMHGMGVKIKNKINRWAHALGNSGYAMPQNCLTISGNSCDRKNGTCEQVMSSRTKFVKVT